MTRKKILAQKSTGLSTRKVNSPEGKKRKGGRMLKGGEEGGIPRRVRRKPLLRCLSKNPSPIKQEEKYQ